MKIQKIYYDREDDERDGNGWNVVDEGAIGGVASRFPTVSEAMAHAKEIGAMFHIATNDEAQRR